MFSKSIVRSMYLGAFIMGVLSPVSAMAQTTSPSAPKEEPTIKEEMKLSTEKDVGYGSDTSFLTWHGYLSLEGHKKQQAVGTFDLHELYLSAKAQIAPKISVTAEFEYEHAAEVLVLPMQAYVDYVFNPALVVRGGMNT